MVQDPKVTDEIGVVANSIRQREKVEKNQEDWKYFARVMDRFFFWVYIVIILVSTLTIFLGRDGEEDSIG